MACAFSGSGEVKVELTPPNDGARMRVKVDGVWTNHFIAASSDGRKLYVVATGLSSGNHTVAKYTFKSSPLTQTVTQGERGEGV